MEPLPPYQPMLAVAGDLPTGAGWAAEMKWDGVRAVCYLAGDRLRLMSRNARDVTVAWPELAPLAHAVERHDGRAVVLDGEIVAFVAGRPSFGALGPRMHLRQPARIRALADAAPVTYLIFDVLHLGDEPQIHHPYQDRRRLLEEVVPRGPRWDVPPSFGDVAHAYAESARLGLEGVVAKRLASPYRPGARHRDWTKTKNFRAQEVVVVGWTAGTGRRADRIGALLLAVPDDDGRLQYAGQVGTGFTEKVLAELAELLAPLERPDPPTAGVPRGDTRGVHWVRPELVGEVVFAEWTGEGRLRHPAWRGLRDDKTPQQVRRE